VIAFDLIVQLPLPTTRGWLWIAFAIATVTLLFHLRAKRWASRAAKLCVPGALVKLEPDCSGGDAIVRILKECPPDRGNRVFLTEIVEWTGFTPEYTAPAKFVRIKTKLESVWPACYISYLAEATCESEVLQLDRGGLHLQPPP
jgi:hypothetical protein